MEATVYSVMYLPDKTATDMAQGFAYINEDVLAQSKPGAGSATTLELVVLPVARDLSRVEAETALFATGATFATIEQVMTLFMQRRLDDGYYLARGSGLFGGKRAYVCNNGRRPQVMTEGSWAFAPAGAFLVGVKK